MKLILEDGSEFTGRSFGAAGSEVAGEVVFNTGMSGYVESLTDPSYRGQILVLTYPLQGNYGVPAPREGTTIDDGYENARIQVQGLVVLQHSERPSHYACKRSLGSWLTSENVPGVEGVDTRALTRKLREAGTMRGWLVRGETARADAERNATGVEMPKVCALVVPPEPVKYQGGPLNILLVDTGAKDSIVRSLLKRGASVHRVPFHKLTPQHIHDCDGVLLSNGPGDPKDMMPLVHTLRETVLAGSKPVFGVCMGNQLLALAAGGDTVKLRYGHRSQNQPVQDLLTRRCYVTSQNHGYVVRDDSLPREWEPWFVNVNDGSNEGIRCRSKPFSSVQFHPEAAPGPEDAAFLFDDFLRLVGSSRS